MDLKRMLLAPLTAGMLAFSVAGCSNDTNKSVQEQEEKLLQNLEETQRKVDYSTKVLDVTLPLAVSYKELHNLYLNPSSYGEDWKYFFSKHNQVMENAYTNLLALEAPAEFQKMHDSYVDVLEATLSLNDKTTELVESGGKLKSDSVKEFEDVTKQFEDIQKETEQLQEFADMVDN